MKKTLIIVLFVCLATLGFSQGEVRFGFTASPSLGFSSIENNSNISDGTTYDKDGSKFGFQYGVLADLDISEEERYFLHTGLIMHHTGVKVNATGGLSGINENVDQNIQYLEIPVALKLKSNEMGYFKYYGLFGVNGGIKVGDKPKDDANADLFSVSGANLGLNVGGGVEYSVSETTQLVGGLEYRNGFSDIENEDNAKIQLKHLVFRIGVYF